MIEIVEDNDDIEIVDKSPVTGKDKKLIEPPIGFHWDDGYGKCLIHPISNRILAKTRPLSRFQNNANSYYKYIAKINQENMLCTLCDSEFGGAGGRNSNIIKHIIQVHHDICPFEHLNEKNGGKFREK